MFRFAATGTIVLVLSTTATADEQAGRQLWRQGAVHYNLGEFAAAEWLFERAYAEDPVPEVLFNLCQSRRRLGRYQQAIDSCKRFLEYRPEAPNRALVEELLAEMTELTRRKPPDTTEAPVATGCTANRIEPTAQVKGRPWYDDPLGWGVSVAGGAGVATGLVFFANASAGQAEAATTVDVREVLDTHQRAQNRRTVGQVLTAVGGAVLVAGVVVLAIHERVERKRSVRVTVAPAAIGIGAHF
jgi:tetratricopeptide (TPR) repeat protein